MVDASKSLAVEAKAELVTVTAQLDIARAVPMELSKKYRVFPLICLPGKI